MRHVNDQLRAYLDGELPPAEAETVNGHVTGCPACAAALAGLRTHGAAATAYLSDADPAGVPDARAALARFHATITHEHPERIHSSTSMTRARQPKVAVPNLSAFTRSFDMLRQRLFGPRLRPVMIGLTALVCLGLLFTIVPVREAAADFLGLFRVRKFAVIPINPEQIQRLESLAESAESMLGEPVVTRDEGPRQIVSDASQASALAGFTVRTPAAPPDRAFFTEFVVQHGPAVHYEVQRTTVESLLQAVGASTAGLPPTDLITVDVDLGPAAILTYRTPQGELNLVQTRSPDVQIPDGVDLVALSETGFQLLGIAPEEARRLATTIDWSSTLVIPMPTDVGEAREVNIDGTTGLLLQSRGDRNAPYSNTMLLWERDGIVHALNAEGMEEMIILQIADSLR
jgi:hypothetical protein